MIAHRTSPTNIGLYLLSLASARDFGWIGTVAAVDRLKATFATLARMDRFRGHFLNWYDTRDLRPLDPRYVSSVDSGNLAGHLIALANACGEWRVVPISDLQRLAGLADAIALVREEAGRLRDQRPAQTVPWRHLDDAVARIAGVVEGAVVEGEPVAFRLKALSANAETLVDMARALASELDGGGADLLFWAEATHRCVVEHSRDLDLGAEEALALEAGLREVERQARAFAIEMEFGFLLNPSRMLLSIGYLVPEATLDESCYDLLASESRLASFIAIAKGDVPARHWFRLGRAVTQVGSSAALVSWSGSMFEYLMPSLVMRTPNESLLGQTNRLVVRRQIEYAASLGVPWGISESAYNARDLELTYQYSNFGIPGLGLKRGLAQNIVVAPYATALSATIAPSLAVKNFGRLADEGASGRYGFCEALDYTPARVPKGDTVAVVRAYMAHHQGMTIVAIADALFDGRMGTRFHSEPMVRAAELLLQERPPRDVGVEHPFAAGGDDRCHRPYRRRRRRASPFHSTYLDARHPSPVKRPLCAHDHRGRLRLQPLGRTGCHAMAGGPRPSTIGARISFSVTCGAARFGPRAISRLASSRTPTRPSSTKIAPRSIAATGPLRPASKSSSLRRTTAKCGA